MIQKKFILNAKVANSASSSIISTEYSAEEPVPEKPPSRPGDPEPKPSKQPPDYPGDPIPEPPSVPPEKSPEPKKPILASIDI